MDNVASMVSKNVVSLIMSGFSDVSENVEAFCMKRMIVGAGIPVSLNFTGDSGINERGSLLSDAAVSAIYSLFFDVVDENMDSDRLAGVLVDCVGGRGQLSSAAVVEVLEFLNSGVAEVRVSSSVRPVFSP